MKIFVMVIIAAIIAYATDYLVRKVKKACSLHTARKVVERVYTENMDEILDNTNKVIEMSKDLFENFDK